MRTARLPTVSRGIPCLGDGWVPNPLDIPTLGPMSGGWVATPRHMHPLGHTLWTYPPRDITTSLGHTLPLDIPTPWTYPQPLDIPTPLEGTWHQRYPPKLVMIGTAVQTQSYTVVSSTKLCNGPHLKT